MADAAAYMQGSDGLLPQKLSPPRKNEPQNNITCGKKGDRMILYKKWIRIDSHPTYKQEEVTKDPLPKQQPA
jgi:hypothetical protein